MTRRPHDLSDLYFGPVLLAVEARLDELGALSPAELAERVAMDADRTATDDALLRTVARFIDLHGWSLSWHARGLRVAHGLHGVVLGVPAVFSSYAASDVPKGRTAAASSR